MGWRAGLLGLCGAPCPCGRQADTKDAVFRDVQPCSEKHGPPGETLGWEVGTWATLRLVSETGQEGWSLMPTWVLEHGGSTV